MKRFHALLLFGVLSATGSAAMAQNEALSPFPPKVLPVLVAVSAKGKVTNVSPAIDLPPSFRRLLARNVSELITKPAYDNGKPVSSQFVMNLALQATPSENGNYDAQFAYISSAPVPIGSWHWVNLEDRRFALAPDDHRTYPVRVGGEPPANGPPNSNNFVPDMISRSENSSSNSGSSNGGHGR